MADNQLRLNSVKDILDETIAFLKPYLPLANAHASEFITENQWDRLIPEPIRDDLMACTDEELRKLPLLGFVDSEDKAFDHLHVRTTICKSDTDIGRGEEGIKSKHEQQEHSSVADAAEEMVLKCVLNENPYRSYSTTGEPTINQSTDIKHLVKNKTSSAGSNKTEKSGNESITKETVNDVSSHNQQHQEWMHASVRDFCQCAWRNTIDGQRLTVSVTEMVEEFGPADNDSDVFVPTYMNLKKSHEIDVMSDACAQLSRSKKCTLVVDIGSGKGYLGQTLCLQHKLTVLGIDAAVSNTSGAEKRLGIVSKQWSGLNRNRENQDNGVKLTKKQKKQLKLKRKEESQNVESNNIENIKNQVEATVLDSDCITDKMVIYSESKFLDTSRCVEKQFESGCYIPVTLYVDTNTDLKNIATEVFSSLSEDETSLHERNISKADSVIHQNSQLKGDTGSVFEAKTWHSKVQEVRDIDVTESQKQFSSPVIGEGDTIFSKTATIQQFTKTCKCDMDIMLTGLHTCGDLASTMLKLFISNPDVKCLCSVGCCYHLLTEEFLQEKPSLEDQYQYGFPLSSYLKKRRVSLGNTARNLASQSVYRMVTSDDLQGYSFYPRALLEKMIVDLADPGSVQWTGLRRLEQRSNGTLDYILKGWKKLKLPEDLVTEELIEAYLEQYRPECRQLAALFQLKAVLAPCIESLILLDRICFLLEQANVRDVILVKMFDPLISPRCYGIVATKT